MINLINSGIYKYQEIHLQLYTAKMKLLSKNIDAKKNLQWGLAKLPQLSISIQRKQMEN